MDRVLSAKYGLLCHESLVAWLRTHHELMQRWLKGTLQITHWFGQQCIVRMLCRSSSLVSLVGKSCLGVAEGCRDGCQWLFLKLGVLRVDLFFVREQGLAGLDVPYFRVLAHVEIDWD